MHNASLIIKLAESADEEIACNRGPEDLYSQNILDNLLSFTVDIRVNEGHVIVARNNVSERRQPFFHAFYTHGFRDRVTQITQFKVRTGGGHQQTVFVTFYYL